MCLKHMENINLIDFYMIRQTLQLEVVSFGLLT